MRVAAGATGTALALAVLAGSAPAATIEPSVKADDITVNGNCTLREAVQAANENTAVDECHKGQAGKRDVIELRKGDYDLELGGDEDLNQTGDLDVLGGGALEIRGRGIAKTEVSSVISDRAIADLADDRLKLAKLTLVGANGGQRGGVIQAGVNGSSDPSLILDRVRVRDGQAQFGGGIGMIEGTLRVKRSIFLDNDAAVTTTGFPGVHAIGGAMNLLFSVDATITDTEFVNNDASMKDSSALGGGIGLAGSGGSVAIRRSLFNGNDVFSTTADAASTRHGGAIHSAAPGRQIMVVNSTFFLNRAIGAGAGAQGGAFFSLDGTSEIANATFAANQATAGSAVFVAGGSVDLSRSALDGTGQGPLCGTAGGAFTSGGYNVAAPDPFGCDLDGPQDEAADPLLAAAPADNGGLTDTIKIGAASPAVDRIPKAQCGPAEGEDQRAFGRPFGPRCDSGAFERGATG